MTDQFTELVHEHETSLRREAESSHVAALVPHRRGLTIAACWAENRYFGVLNWFSRGQLGPGYAAPRVRCTC